MDRDLTIYAIACLNLTLISSNHENRAKVAEKAKLRNQSFEFIAICTVIAMELFKDKPELRLTVPHGPGDISNYGLIYHKWLKGELHSRG